MRFALANRLADVPVGQLQWNALVAQTAGATVFQTYEWFACWWKAFGGRNSLFLVTLWDDETLVGIAPLMLVRRAGLRQLEFAGSPNSDYQDFILGDRDAELLPQFISYLYQQRNAWDLIVLRNVPTDSLTFELLPAKMRSLGLGTTDHERVACPTLEISSRPAEIRRWLDSYGIRRRMTQLRRRGELVYTRCTDQAQLEHYLPLFFEQYVERRHGSEAAEFFQRMDVRIFFQDLAASLLPRGWLHFSVLECAGQPAAFHFGFEFGGRLYWYKPSFDPKLAHQSPGTVLLSFLVRDSLETGQNELDFTVGAEAFKYRYANAQRFNANLRVFARRPVYILALAVAWARRTGGRCIRALGISPFNVTNPNTIRHGSASGRPRDRM